MKRSAQNNIEAVLPAIDFIETHLQEAITVADIAGSVSLSLFYFSRIFNQVTRHTPYDYLMRRRLSVAAERLLESDKRIIEIALDYQFNAPESFSRAFKRVFYMQPRQARQQGGFDRRLLLARLTRAYLEFLNSGVPLKPAARQMPALDIAGFAAQIRSQDARRELNRLWQAFAEEMGHEGWVDGEREFLGLLISPRIPGRPLMALAGMVMEEGEAVPLGFVQKRLPAMQVASFAIPAEPLAISFMRQYAQQSWWPQAASTPLPRFEIERLAIMHVGSPFTAENLHPISLSLPLPAP
jgi:AraC family transcriptional regulator